MNLHHRYRSKNDPRRLPGTKQLGLRSAKGRCARPLAARPRASQRSPHRPRGPAAGTPACAAPSRPSGLRPRPALPRPALLLQAGFGRPAATAAASPGGRSGNAYIDCPRLSGSTRAINQGRRRKDAARRLPNRNLLRDLSLPRGAQSSPLPGARASSFLPAPQHGAPLDVAHVPDSGPRAASAPARTPGHARTRAAAGPAAYLRGLMVASLAWMPWTSFRTAQFKALG
uniref:uncharacterized protein LOC114677741 n=1 Tax=Macaca mulatta TaxID=9544 RepID=UPI0010A258E6|nr:uncharacterized protein LOC114677741 [Macaca mulatta]